MRLSMLRSGTWWIAALKRSALQLFDNALWSHFLPSEAMSALIFVTVARVQALTYDLLCLRNQCYPQRLLDLISPDIAMPRGRDSRVPLSTLLLSGHILHKTP